MFSRSLKLSLLVGGALLLGACDDDDGGNTHLDSLDQQLVINFADAVVVPTYNQLATRMVELDAAARALRNAPSAATLKAAQDAWFAARVPWEQSESFLFGPVDSKGWDPAMDSWPVNRTDLDEVLGNGDTLSQQYVSALDPTQKGYHTTEYLLFGEGQAKKPEDFTARQFEYLTALTAELKTVSANLAASWTTGVDGQPPYRDVLATAGDAGNAIYPTVESAAQEMLGGVLVILDEVANGKIADPYDAKDANLVESQFALNSLSDFTNNLRSAENVYLGHLSGQGAKGLSMSDVVKERDAALDTRVKAELAAAIAALGRVPEPFPVSIKDPASADEIEGAQEAIKKLHDTFQNEVKAVILP
ncbi:imelysin family protein [Corallococcus llansteffanensis]|uniref:Peptidase M75 n=1 Tax=Corallococcus llansteffanensis TaxID=2316731 RepID=A0A3A8QEL6_9BACT|nr:imelysin family protein [Corallococcus llansteffanensis]RKH66071.1 peptidase M75 [Corallococcus llansteffanensis]